jgi:uncharacterized protein (DUF2141 family)
MRGLAILLALSAASPPPADLTVSVQGLRNHRGAVRVCLTQRADLYLKCNIDPKRIARSLPASGAAKVTFDDLNPGTYVVVLLHDENENNKLDTLFKIPKEGFGFSRNPAIRMGPPKYDQVKITIAPGHNEQAVTFKYIL